MTFPQTQPGEQPRVLVQTGIQCGAVSDRQRTGQGQPHHGAVLVRHQIQVQVQVGDVPAGVDLVVQRNEPPAADATGVDGDGMSRVAFVDVDH
ncbi:Uncharacterised protein [Mycobacterium tuberculosis]|nr:Uncharacterised protein [Mycobacterium tuberculosis]COX26323.1 Uncharacterised protein [Mycobacterium tuberculosis]